ncbi:hypothetical protein AA103196_1948 [Ameyamaea chiangmaiensis NBRC 103196]|uniref:Uncharacterized protein n=1 Tax=Ameyamaea chiangmaiensis TaxID=442969 RepID=A0A850P3H3_9PROT|nr:hypothetical protein [Ameyamaea chiangmaiensis]MBS4073787.1 hypothetical protein [Ameyamaea chiangmaiensis]NVN39217.1 hypothetical protein [Ameyamaea chiangmaiensis]GBQ68451.1 hypothetical protein AA103196_1948 [Ameyamaea chiangmaiensis NBRC 103196]
MNVRFIASVAIMLGALGFGHGSAHAWGYYGGHYWHRPHYWHPYYPPPPPRPWGWSRGYCYGPPPPPPPPRPWGW